LIRCISSQKLANPSEGLFGIMHRDAENGRDHPARALKAKPMIFCWFTPTSRDASIASLYGAIVAQARSPAFYQAYRVPDTVTGRLEMIILHAILVLRRLQAGSPAACELGQALFDRFCQDMDDNMREMGVGDLAVPRKMRRIAEVFYGRQSAYGAALTAAQNGDLAAVLARNVFADSPETDGPARLAAYSRATLDGLAAQNRFERGEISFPDPEQVVHHG
jgi:cytochrome b pre-mRNA-processing protein 3